MGLDWFDRMTDKIETKANQVLKKTGDNVADIGRNFVDTVVPRAPLAPEKRSNFLAQSRKATGANRHTRAANLPDDVLIEKRWTAQEKLRKYLGKTTGSTTVAVVAVKTLQPDHAYTQGIGTAINLAHTTNAAVREEVYIGEYKRRGFKDDTCGRKPREGMFRQGLREGTIDQLRSERNTIVAQEVFQPVHHFISSNDAAPSVPVYQAPPINVPTYTTTYTQFPAGIPTTPVHKYTYE